MKKSTLKTRFRRSFAFSASSLLVAAFIAAALPSTASAQLALLPEDETPKVTAKLIAEQDGIKPGGDLWVALRQDITPGWHTYWRNPGDTGLATDIKWTLPEGYTASDLHFPTPHRYPMAGMTNFGYEDNVLLLAKITAPAAAPVGTTVKFMANASWLVCKEVCIPEKGEYTLDIKVTDNPTSSPWESAFTATRKKLPATHTAKQDIAITDDAIIVTLNPMPLATDTLPEEAFFYPHDGLLIEHSGQQHLELNGRALKLTIPRNKARSEAIAMVSGDIWLRSTFDDYSFTFLATVPQPPAAPVVAATPTAAPKATAPTTDTAATHATTQTTQSGIGFFSAMLLAFLGGVLLNLMPCVFPVLSLKALGLVQKSHADKKADVMMGGIAYLAGVLASFTVLGIILILMKQAGQHIGWGMQLQSPIFVASLALLLFFIGFALIGGVTISSRMMGIGQSLTQSSGHAASFFTGALAVIVATPCTAPFMGGAVFYALTQNWFITLLVLWALGFGLAFPYVLLTLFPNSLARALPKPGIWMENFKRFLAFPMWGAAIWLVWVLAQQNGSTGVLYVLMSMLFMAFGFWLWQTMYNRQPSIWHYTKGVLAVVAILLSLILIGKQPAVMAIDNTRVNATTANYEPFDADKLQEYRDAGKPVFVNMTAAWCITCLANEKAALATDTVQNTFKERGIMYMKGDWTNYDESITAYLKEFGRSGVPIYVFYPAGKIGEPVVLPQLLTPSIVLEHLGGDK